MILFKDDFAAERCGIHYSTKNKSFVRIAMVLKHLGVANYNFPLALYQTDLANYDPHHLTDNSEELRLRIALECRLNPWYFFREIARIPASGGDPIAIRANRAFLAMAWCFFNNISYIAIQPRQTGKAGTLDSLIRIPGGWIRMGDIAIGDKVVTPDGSITDVVGIYPQSSDLAYRITFEDGRHTECCEQHLWKIYNGAEWEVISLSDIIEQSKSYPNEEFAIPLIEHQIMDDISLPIDPYMLGILLSDHAAHVGYAGFSIENNTLVVEQDNFSIQRNDIIRTLTASKKNRSDIAIPEIYINASKAQKIALLQGLFDLDGIVASDSSIELQLTSVVLATQIQSIVRSIGGLCWKVTGSKSNHDLTTYTLNIRITDPHTLFRFSTNKSKLTKRLNPIIDRINIKSIECVGTKELQCIEVSHPDHLYIADDYIVTHNTVGACAVLCWVIYLGGSNIEITLYTKDSSLVQANVGRIKTMRDSLPKYLIHGTGNDIDNKEGLSYATLKNMYRTSVAQKDRQGADNLGRGMTSPVIHNDEPGFCSNIDITYPVMMLSTIAAVQNAKSRNQPHSNLLTTTAAPIDTARGKFTFDLVNRAMPFTETLYDLPNKETVQKTVRSNSINGMINGTFSYLMLGLDREWYDNACRISEASEDVNNRELLNMWTSGSETSIISAKTIKTMNAYRAEPKHSEMIGDYIVKWYLTPEFLATNEFKAHRYVLGMDSSENIGMDFTTLVMIDISDMSVACTFRCNESNTIKIGMFIAEFLLKYKNVTFIPERNSTGTAIIDVITLMFQKWRLNPFRRIFNQIVQNRDDKDMAMINLDDPNYSDTSIKRHLGFRTTGRTRPFLYKNTLNKAADMNATRIYDITLVAELSALSALNGRIDHASSGHDDMVIAYLLCCWLVYFGKYLDNYGIDSRNILTRITNDGQMIDPVHRDNQLEIRRSIKYYEDLMQSTDSQVVRNTYRQQIALLQNKLDHTITIEPVGVDKIARDVQDYGSTLYTPQEFYKPPAQQDKNAYNNVRNLMRFL